MSRLQHLSLRLASVFLLFLHIRIFFKPRRGRASGYLSLALLTNPNNGRRLKITMYCTCKDNQASSLLLFL